MDRGAWQIAVQGVSESDKTEWACNDNQNQATFLQLSAWAKLADFGYLFSLYLFCFFAAQLKV